MKKVLFVVFCIIIPVCICYAQNAVVKGTVTDSKTGETIVGVGVGIKGTTKATQTDVDGNFSISVPKGEVYLVFKYLGYVSQEVKVVAQRNIDVKLIPDVTSLDEVVAIGYALVKRKDLTGSVSSINERQLKDVPINSAAQALTGRIAGLQVTTSEGSPDADIKIRIRGGGSITQDNSPLYIIDGIQVEEGLTSLSPQDIESIDVLKDASATAIYGARGANGVILVTTKGGREGNTVVSYNYFAGVNQLNKKLEVMKPYDFLVYNYERSRGNTSDSTAFANRYGATFASLSAFQNDNGIDWQQELLGRDAFMQTHNASISGGAKGTKFNTSYSNNRQQGVLLNSDFVRHTLNSKFTHSLSSKATVGVNFRYTDTHTEGAGVSDPSSAQFNGLRNIIKYRPIIPGALSVDEEDSDYFSETNVGNGLGIVNPIVLNNARYRNKKNVISNYNGYLNYEFNKFFSFRSTIGININKLQTDAFNDVVSVNTLSQATMVYQQANTLNQSNVLNFSNARSKSAFAKKNEISALIGQEIFISRTKGLDTRFVDFPTGTDATKALNQPTLGKALATYPQVIAYNNKLLSFFSRANYTYNNKYLATLTLRADGSSKFGPTNKWGFFPSGSFAWRLSEEKFMKPLLAKISDLKLRVSYGQSGNNRINDYLYQTSFSYTSLYPLNNDLTSIGYESLDLPNPNLKWETTVSKNIGLDVGLLKNKIQFSIDAYQNDVNNVLIKSPVPNTSGYTTQLRNIGATSNKGIELQLSAYLVQNKNFTWSSNFNISFNKNEIKKISDEQLSYFQNSLWGISGQSADYLVQVGKPIGSMFGYVTDGFYTVNDFNYDPTTRIYTLKAGIPNPTAAIGVVQPGSIKFRDIDNNGVVDLNDRQVIGNANPDFYGGLNQMFTYKNFDASIFLNFQFGNDVLNANKIEFTNGYAPSTNLLATMNDRWKTIDANGKVLQRVVTVGGQTVVAGAPPAELAAANANANIWMPLRGNLGYTLHSWAVEDGSFLRVNNVTVGYTFGSSLLKTLHVKKLRVYATVNNLAILTSYTGYDPEVNTRRATPLTPGVDYSAYPRSRTYLFGINLGL